MNILVPSLLFVFFFLGKDYEQLSENVNKIQKEIHRVPTQIKVSLYSQQHTLLQNELQYS